MRAKALHGKEERVFAVIFDLGEDPIVGLTRFAEELTGRACDMAACLATLK